MKILIGYDGSPDANCALKELESSGLPTKAHALVFSAAPPWHADQYALTTAGLAREAKQIAEEALKRVNAQAEKAAAQVNLAFPEWKVSSESVMDSPAHGLIVKADAWKPDLVVLGCHGRSAIGKLLMGSVSAKLLHYCLSDIRITRIRKKSNAMLRVLIAVDGSPGSDFAVKAAASRSWPEGTTIRVVGVVEGDGFSKTVEEILGLTFAKKGQNAKSMWLKAKSESAAKLLSSQGWNTEAIIRKGDPRMVILNEVKTWKADCIFLGSRGLGGIDRFTLGSVSSSVAAHAECTVEIVRKKMRGVPPSRK